MKLEDVFNELYNRTDEALDELVAEATEPAYRLVSSNLSLFSQCRVLLIYGRGQEVLPQDVWQELNSQTLNYGAWWAGFEGFWTKLRHGDPEAIAHVRKSLSVDHDKDIELIKTLTTHLTDESDTETIAQAIEIRIQQFADDMQRFVPDPPELRDAFLKYLQKTGGFGLNYIVFQNIDTDNPDYATLNHRALEQLAHDEGWPEILTTYDPSKLSSQQVTPEQFLGPGYDFATRKLIVHGDTDRNSYFYHDETQETQKNRIFPTKRESAICGTLDLYSDYSRRGYAQAFTDPVYGLNLTKAEKNDLFGRVNTVLFSDFEDQLEIRQWSTDWSSYFEPGKEWWGAYWWTVHNKTKCWVIVITASQTD